MSAAVGQNNLSKNISAESILSSDPLNTGNMSPPTLQAQSSTNSAGADSNIQDVWLHNFFEIMDDIAKLVDEFNYIAMDTEFPGTVYVPPNTDNEFDYNMIKANCDHLKLIQVGISLFNSKGDSPPNKILAYQFNLKFDEAQEQHKSIEDSMSMLRQQGLSFERHKTDGIPQHLLAQYLITSGLCMNGRTHWLTFHGGIDFGYLLRQLMNNNLPTKQDEFLECLKWFFGNFYDCKEIKREIDYLSGGLAKVAKELDVDRVGTMHQAGSDAFVTAGVFFKLKNKLKKLWNLDGEGKIEERLNGKLFGIGDSINDDPYMEYYRSCAMKLQYADSTGNVNLRMYSLGYSNQSNQPGQSSGSAHGHLQNMMDRNTGSAHGMIMTQGNNHHQINDMSGMNGLKSPMTTMQNNNNSNMGHGNDMHLKQSMMDMQYKAGTQDNQFMQSSWMQNTSGQNMMAGHHMMNTGSGMQGMNQGGNSGSGVDGYHNQMGSMMQGSGVDHSVGHMGGVHGNAGGSNLGHQSANLVAQIGALGQLGNSAAFNQMSMNLGGQGNGQQVQNVGHQQQQMFLHPLQQQSLMNAAGQLGVDDSDLMGQGNQHGQNRMMNYMQATQPNNSFGGSNNQLNQFSPQINYNPHHQYAHPHHQQMFDASGQGYSGAGGQTGNNGSPNQQQMMNSMMAAHASQMQQMNNQQHNGFYRPQ